MNYYDARQRQDKRWDYTVMNDNRIRPVGYCPDCGSHDTAEEARECFARYLLDGSREEKYADWTGCQYVVNGGKCDRPTKAGLTTRPPLGHGYALCDEHRTYEILRELAPRSIGQIMSSH